MTSDQGCAEDTQSVESTVVAATHFMPRVLLVDDEPHVVEGVRRAFRKYPYRISTATSPELALQLFRREQFDVIVADEQMPGMRGSELLTVIAREFPTSGRILLTGHATGEAAARAINEAGVIRFLLKPCSPQDLRDAIEAALKTTPFEKRARTSRKRVFLVRQERPARRTRGAGQAAHADRTRGVAAWCADSGGEPHEPVKARLEWDTSELLLQAQKVLVLEDESTLFGYELSARLRTQAGQVHTVGNYIASADHTVRLPSVDRLVVRHAINVLREYEPLLQRRRLTVSLNIGGQSLADPEFAQFLDSELSAASIASRFMIEIREAALAKRLQTDSELFSRLVEMNCFRRGCRLCVDGVSGEVEQLASLSSLPLAVAKIDSRYIGDILTNRESESRVRAIVKWGQRAGVDIAATGIETVAISERLRALGVRYGQGSAFGGPELLNLVLGSLYN
jgi:EAL domain-containing protein (putative c-di-GMP-specific phosphodiesterase class I)/CheY-like chemotaxis protein